MSDKPVFGTPVPLDINSMMHEPWQEELGDPHQTETLPGLEADEELTDAERRLRYETGIRESER